VAKNGILFFLCPPMANLPKAHPFVAFQVLVPSTWLLTIAERNKK
jgi:hypothetical protein